MVGLSGFAIGAAPVLGGALLAIAGGQLMNGWSFRDSIKDDIELLALLPEEDAERRAALRQSIAERVDDLIEANARRRQIRTAALSYQGHLRDVVMFTSSVLFGVVWWYVDHDRAVWLPVFVLLIASATLSALFAWRGIRMTLRRLRRGRQRQ